MNVLRSVMLALLATWSSPCSQGRQIGSGHYRVSASNDVVITAICAVGLMSWSNSTAGTMARVETVNGLATGAWHTYTHVSSTGHEASVRLWDSRTPDGFAFCPAGTFIMGAPTNELGQVSDDDERQHQVTLTRDFFMQKTEVTNRQMADVLNWALGQGDISVTSNTVQNLEGDQQELLALGNENCQVSWNGTQLVVDAGKDDYPCIEVTWYGAQAYCNFLSDMAGLNRAIAFSDWSMDLDASGYRLPTESEWEYACRTGTTTAFYTGGITYPDWDPVDPNLGLAGWYFGNSTNPENPMHSGKGTHPVGQKEANGWGLFDMHGNVGEWCWDRHGTYPETATDPTGPASGSYRVLRGGAWTMTADYCRAAMRISSLQWFAFSEMGFRPVRIAVP